MKLIKYSADWCAPCKNLSRILKDMSLEYEEVDVMENPDEIVALGIKSIPVLRFLKDGVEVKRLVGEKSKKQIQEVLDEMA